MNAFKAGTLYAISEGGALLLQVCSDFDIAQRTLDMSLGKSKRFLPLFAPNCTTTLGEVDQARTWTINSQKQFDYVFETFFRRYEDPSRVRNKPVIHNLVLVPIDIDKPIIANDLGDRQ